MADKKFVQPLAGGDLKSGGDGTVLGKLHQNADGTYSVQVYLDTVAEGPLQVAFTGSSPTLPDIVRLEDGSVVGRYLTVDAAGKIGISSLPAGLAQDSTLSAVQTVLGATTDAAVAGDNPGTIKAALRYLAKVFASVWSGSRLLVSGDPTVALPVTQSAAPWQTQPLPTIRDTANEQSSNLGANATFTGAWKNVSEYGSLVVSWFSLQQPASFNVEFSADGITEDVNTRQTIAPVFLPSAGFWTIFASFNPTGNTYYRIVVTNGSSAQTFVGAESLLTAEPYTGQYQSLGNQPTLASPALLVRAILAGQRTDTGAFQNVAVDPNGGATMNILDAFNQSLGGEAISLPYISQDKVQFNAPFANNNVTTVATGGATTAQSAANGAVLTSANAAGASQSQIQGQKKIRFSPGRECAMEFNALYPAAGLASSDAVVGLSDTVTAPLGGAANSLLVGYNGTTFGLHVVGGGAITTTAKASWNGDKLDGSAFSAFQSGGVPVALDITKANDWRIKYVWGLGPVQIQVKDPDGDWVVAHEVRYPNTATVPYIQNPDLFMVWDVTKQAGAGTGTLAIKSFAANAGTVEPEIDFEQHEIHGHKQVDVALSGQSILNTASTNLYTVSAGRQLLVKTVTLSMNNTGTGQRLELRDGGATGTLRYVLQAAPQANGAVAASPTFPIPLIFLTDVTIVGVGTGTLTISGAVVGYEKES